MISASVLSISKLIANNLKLNVLKLFDYLKNLVNSLNDAREAKKVKTKKSTDLQDQLFFENCDLGIWPRSISLFHSPSLSG